MATAAVRLPTPCYGEQCTDNSQNPPLYLHVTSTSKSGLEKAIEKIDELMKQELPNLVDERRFRRREPEQFERDEFGRVCSLPTYTTSIITDQASENGQKKGYPLTWKMSQASIFEPR